MALTENNQLISINPADGQEVGRVQLTSLDELQQVVERAHGVYENSGWKERLPHQKSEILRKIADGLLAKKEFLANLQMKDNGKPLAECRSMVDYAVGAFRYYASAIETLETEVTPPRGDYVSMTVLEPFGVVAAITPWNSPIMNDATKVAPALAAGNAVILKPSEESPLLAPELAKIALEAGLPEGLLQVVQGFGHDLGSALVEHPHVRMVTFTGGTNTGRLIGEAAGRKIIPVALELGGKSPHIVFEDADFEHAVAAVVSGVFGSAGQSCVAGSRLFVQESVYEQVLTAVVERTKKIIVGAPDMNGVEVGPLASFEHRERVKQFVERARKEGGSILCGGQEPDDERLKQGAYYLPTIIEGLSNQSLTCQEEAFGPVLVVLPFKDETDLIKQANDTDFGLACGIWSQDFKKAWRVGRALEAGSVWINTYKQSVTTTPFGGFKDSGIGREKGLNGLKIYTQTKSMFFGLHKNPLPLAK